MNSSNFYKEERASVLEKMEALVALATLEERELTDDEATSFDNMNSNAEELNNKAERALKMEEMKKKEVRNVVSEEEKVKRSYSFLKHIDGIANNNLSGVEKEVQEQAVSEARSNGNSIQGAGIPASMFEKRADITSNIAGTSVEAFVDAIREDAFYTQLGAKFLNLNADARIPIINKQSTAWMSAENTAAADGGAAFESVTLSPKRIAGYVNISKELIHQNGAGVETAIMADLGKSVADNIALAMFNDTTVSNAPTSISATTGVGTFTEESSFAAGVSCFKDLVSAEQELALANALSGDLAYVLSPKFLKELKTAAQVSGVSPAMAGMVYNQQMVNGYRTYYSNFCGQSASDAHGLFGDFSQVVVGMFGGVDVVVDPFSVAINNQVRLVVNTLVDFALPQGERFVKFQSLIA